MATKKKRTAEARSEQQTLGAFLRTIRMSIPFTLREAEQASGVSNAYLSQLESGKIAKPSPPFLHKLAAAYGVSYEALMEKAGYVGQSAQPRLTGRLATFAGQDLTPEEEQELLKYLGYIRSLKKE